MALRVFILLLAAASAGAAPAEATLPAPINTEKRAIEARFHQAEQACRERFQVTACVDEAKAQRRSALAVLRAQQSRMDDDRRRRRAAERLQSIEDKRGEAEARVPASAASAPAPRASSPPAPVVKHNRVGSADGGAPAAAHRATEAGIRRQQAEHERARIAQHVAQAKNVAPLPAPGASAGNAGAVAPPR